VLDLTNVAGRPFATMHLALAGAEVIKIENPRAAIWRAKLGQRPGAEPAADGHQLPRPERQQRSLT